MQKPELELIIETVPDAIVVIDNSGGIVYANRAAEIMLDIDRAELGTGTHYTSIWTTTTPDGKSIPNENLPVSRVIKNKEPVLKEELAVKQRNGKLIIISVNAIPVLDKQGSIKYVVCLLYTSDAADELDGVDLGGGGSV
jgi:PAS domain S-box-containing protein